jgi:type IV pilus assembly protein PilC
LLLEAGISIITALELLQGEISKRSLKQILGQVISDLRGGNQLSTSLAKHPRIFPLIYCRLLSVGERAGNLETMLRQIADYMEKRSTTAKKIKSALRYPIIIGVVAVVVVIILVTFVFPAFSKLYTSLGTELPAISRIVFDGVGKLRSLGIYILLAALVAVGLVFIYSKSPQGKYKLHQLFLKLPLVGRVIHLNLLAGCCRNISLLYNAGLPMTEIMPLLIQASGNSVMAKALTDVHRDMIQGEGLSRPMQKNRLFLPMMVQMVKVGEETGNLNIALSAAAQSYETEAEDRTSSLISFIEPLMTGIIGMVVGFIAISLFSAIYSIYGQLS